VARTSSSSNHFVDTNVVLHHANNDSGPHASDIAQIFEEATGATPSRKLFMSSILFAELRPSSFRPGKFKDYEEFLRYVRSLATVITPDPNIMLRVARMRDLRWKRPNARPEEKPKMLSMGDAIHLASALFVKEGYQIADLEFVTFDNKSETTIEVDDQTKSLPILTLDEFTGGIGANADVVALLRLPRVRPILTQSNIDWNTPQDSE